MRANVYCPDGHFHDCEFCYADTVSSLTVLHAAPIETNEYVIPGLIDIHTHGALGVDFCDADPNGMAKLANYYAEKGVTGFLATTMTCEAARLFRVMETVRAFEPGQNNARCLGVHLEGPFLSPNKCGAQNKAFMLAPDVSLFTQLYKASGGRIRLVSLAPETDADYFFTERISKLCRVSLAHTEADYDTAIAAFQHGADHVTHLFNAMPPLMHRAPGVIGAAFDSRAYAELIADGIHVHESAVRAAFTLFGPDRICLVSDSLRSAGLSDGSYALCGQTVSVQNGRATLSDGTIAGSNIHLMDALQNAIAFGIDPEIAVRAATANPAASIGCENLAGSLAVGRRADFVVLDRRFGVQAVFLAGRSIR